jgi:hypothetical protein
MNNLVDYYVAGEDNSNSEGEKPHADMFHGFTQPAQLDNLLLSTQGLAFFYSTCALHTALNRFNVSIFVNALRI